MGETFANELFSFAHPLRVENLRTKHVERKLVLGEIKSKRSCQLAAGVRPRPMACDLRDLSLCTLHFFILRHVKHDPAAKNARGGAGGGTAPARFAHSHTHIKRKERRHVWRRRQGTPRMLYLVRAWHLLSECSYLVTLWLSSSSRCRRRRSDCAEQRCGLRPGQLWQHAQE